MMQNDSGPLASAAATAASSQTNKTSPDPASLQVAQLTTTPIGEVTELTGSATTIRAAGPTESLALGSPLFEDDTVLTQPGSSVAVTFVDGTEFTLAGDGRIVLDRMIYDPNGSDNELAIDLLQGSFAFISGEVSKVAGPGLSLDTPVGTIGVRGTAVIGDYDLVRLLVSLLQGAIGFSNDVAQALLATTLDTLQVESPDQADLEVRPMAPEDQAIYGDLLPRILDRLGPEAGEQEQDGGQEGGNRVLPIEPTPPDNGSIDTDEGFERGDLDDLTEEDIRDIAAVIIEEFAEENPNLVLLTQQQPAEDQGAAAPPPAPPANPADGSFETGFTGWTTDGDSTIQTAAFLSGPTEGLQQALLTTEPPPAPDAPATAAEIETLLGLALGSLTGLGNGVVTEGAVIVGNFVLNDGDVLSFDYNFLTDEIPAPGAINDFAFVTINGELFELADTLDPLVTSDTVFVDETGFRVFEFVAPADGVITIGVGVVDVGDTGFKSGLLVDNFAVTPAGGGEEVPQLIDA